MLIECLEKQKENGRMTSNSSWHRLVQLGWMPRRLLMDLRSPAVAARKPESAAKIVGLLYAFILFYFLYLISCSSLKRNMPKSGSFVTSLVLAGMMDSPVSLRQMKCGMHS